MAAKKKSYGLQKRSREKFRLDPTKPLEQHEHESDRMFGYFQAYAANPGLKLRELEPLMGVALASISRYRKLYRWDERLKLANIAKLEEQAQGGPLTLTDREITSKLPPPPPPIMRGLHVFAQRFGPLIAPGFEIDAIVDVMLQELESWVEGKFGGRLLMNPPPRSSKTVCAILALAYSLMRFPLRGHILLSANARLASESNAMLRTVVEAALPEGYDLSTDSKSKLGFKIGCQGAHLNVALSRGASLLGWTAHLLLCDDLLGQIHEAEKPELMQTTMRTLTVDALTRLTKDPYGKGGGLCITAQRLGPEDPTGQLISKEKVAEAEGLQTTPWTVVACPFLSPTEECKAEIVGQYPNSWRVRQPQYGEPGTPVSHRFPPEFAASLQAQMPPQDFAAMYCLDVTQDAGWCSWKTSFINEIDPEEVTIKGTMLAIDMSLNGGDDSALVAVGMQDQAVVIVGLHFLKGDVDEALPQIVEFAERYNAHTIGVEKAAYGFRILKSLDNRIGQRSFDVIGLSHEGRSKKTRQAQILGLGANGKILAVNGLELLQVLHAQMRNIALDKKRAPDDLADAATYGIRFVAERWIRSGFSPGDVRWQGGSNGAPGVTECSWGYGRPVPRVGIDGVERYSLPGFS